ncbi:hypothetical protein IscW_ISCW004506 [Ixodes scapularis]|uniref:Uncharacterized protein n=1 Tax=Ixodes scapularis TaxID=6945 RepID=B7PH84_IXOSC|nr:hypothetical protein IscW_ISCW004506 [Ixodes scapularis]|eukprot:XP_002402315.1 hypothetical protein IscW_ISCW004506 [Ixodes scapularis]
MPPHLFPRSCHHSKRSAALEPFELCFETHRVTFMRVCVGVLAVNVCVCVSVFHVKRKKNEINDPSGTFGMGRFNKPRLASECRGGSSEPVRRRGREQASCRHLSKMVGATCRHLRLCVDSAGVV